MSSELHDIVNGQAPWIETSLGSLCGTRGKSIDPSKHPNEGFELYSVPSHSTGQPELVSGSSIGSTKQLVEPRSVLLCKINPRINRSWVVGSFSGRRQIASTEWIIFPPSETVAAEFLAYYLQQEKIRSFLAHNASGVGGSLMRVKASTLSKLPFSHPEDLEEQRAIVAEIDKQFTRLEAGLTGLRRVQANLKRYRAAVLKAAYEGTLTHTNAKSWRRGTLGDVLTAIEAGKSFRCEERPPSHTEVGIVKVSAVTWGRYNENESKTCLDSSRIEERFLVQPGDFLFSRANTIELVGACVIAKQVSLRVMLSDKILRFRFSKDVLPEWVLYWLRSQVGRHEIERLATGNQMSMRNIGQERIRQIHLPIPLVSEQSLIVSEVERRLSIVDELEAVVTTNIQRANCLRQSILQQAFTGELI